MRQLVLVKRGPREPHLNPAPSREFLARQRFGLPRHHEARRCPKGTLKEILCQLHPELTF